LVGDMGDLRIMTRLKTLPIASPPRCLVMAVLQASPPQINRVEQELESSMELRVERNLGAKQVDVALTNAGLRRAYGPIEIMLAPPLLCLNGYRFGTGPSNLQHPLRGDVSPLQPVPQARSARTRR